MASEDSPLIPLTLSLSGQSSRGFNFPDKMRILAIAIVVATGILVSVYSDMPSKRSILMAIVPPSLVPFDPASIAGYYSDPNHPNCQRIIEVAGKIASLTGTDGDPGCPPDGSGETWTLQGKIKGNTILVDFSPKGGPSDLKGVYNETAPAGINWPDGNKWTKIAEK